MFRVEDDRIAETWLPAMGVHAPMAYPRPETAWADSAIPDQNQSQLSPNKSLIKNWYHDLAIGQDVTRHLAPTVGWHDMHDANLELAPDALQSRLRDLMQGDLAEGLKLHLIEGVISSQTHAYGHSGRISGGGIGYRSSRSRTG